MRPHPHRAALRARQIGIVAAFAIALIVMAGIVQAPLATAGQEPVRDGVIELQPIGEVTPESIAGTTTSPSGGDSLLAEEDAQLFAPTNDDGTRNEDLDKPLGKLRQTRAALALERDELQVRVLRLEDVRSRAESRLDRATDALASRLVTQFEAGEQVAVQALIDVRDTPDPDERAALLASMDRTDRAVIQELDAARAAVEAAAARAEAVRGALRTITLRVSAIDTVIEDRRPSSRSERERAAGKRFSIDSSLVFTTGAIPGIGYWGESTGGGMLTGWSGYAGAAMGGVGCTAPEAGYSASGSIEAGEASWYGPGFHGNRTASGEVYDQNAMTAAHKTLPFGTIVRVLSSSTGRCAFVRITDRGPFIAGRIIDLSQAAATQIGMSGVAPVQIEVWSKP